MVKLDWQRTNLAAVLKLELSPDELGKPRTLPSDPFRALIYTLLVRHLWFCNNRDCLFYDTEIRVESSTSTRALNQIKKNLKFKLPSPHCCPRGGRRIFPPVHVLATPPPPPCVVPGSLCHRYPLFSSPAQKDERARGRYIG